MQTILQFLKQPFPYFQKKWQMVVIVAISVSIVLTIVSTFFQINDDNPSNNFLMALNIGGYTIVSGFCTAIVVYLFPVLFPRFFNENQWTRGKFFVFAFILTSMITVANTLYGYYFLRHFFDSDSEINLTFWTSFYLYLITTFPVGIIPASFGYFWLKNQGLYSDLHEIKDQNQKLIFRLRKENTSEEKIITLSGNTKDSLTLFPRELLYMESVGNYVKIHYQVNARISQKILRATLSQMEEFLSEYPFFVRCHRAFIVNTHQIEKVKGSKLWLKSIQTHIPISKTYKSHVSSLAGR